MGSHSTRKTPVPESESSLQEVAAKPAATTAATPRSVRIRYLRILFISIDLYAQHDGTPRIAIRCRREVGRRGDRHGRCGGQPRELEGIVIGIGHVGEGEVVARPRGTGAGRNRMAAVTAHRSAVVDPDVDRGGLARPCHGIERQFLVARERCPQRLGGEYAGKAARPELETRSGLAVDRRVGRIVTVGRAGGSRDELAHGGIDALGSR